MMSQAKAPDAWSVVAVYPDQASMERAVRRLHEDGFDMRHVSLIGREFAVNDRPIGFVTTGDYVEAGAEIGAFLGGILGLCVGVGFLILPGLGFVIVTGPVAAAILAGMEGSLAGAAVGALAGAFVGSGVPAGHAATYESHVKGGKFLVVARGDSSMIEQARSVLASEAAEHLEVFENTRPAACR
jgi:hypothetical protein